MDSILAKKITELEKTQKDEQNDPKSSKIDKKKGNQAKNLTKIEKLLNFKIEPRGQNLSLGERQLICICRALIQQPKILLMDEATANIDEKTDSIIQEVILKKLTNTTVLTIAHRLNTIMTYDKILVMENGKLKEQGTPLELLDTSDSEFKSMVMDGGMNFY